MIFSYETETETRLIRIMKIFFKMASFYWLEPLGGGPRRQGLGFTPYATPRFPPIKKKHAWFLYTYISRLNSLI